VIQQKISGSTTLCIALGDPVASSLSPRMHNSAYAARGLEGKFVYVAARVSSMQLPQAIAGIRALGIRGASCLMPHKTALLSLVDVVDQHALQIGAINTLVNREGVLTGYNTDWIGVARSLEEATSLQGKQAVILGNGGAARAAAYGVRLSGANVHIIGRSLERAQELASLVDGTASTFEDVALVVPKADVIVNATPLGMEASDISPLPQDLLQPYHTVLDTVYHPHETLLLRQTLECGGTAVYGISMLLHQGVEQFKLFTELEPPIEVMRQVLWDAIA
jgi:shikimate dehydrogenase